MATLTDNRQRAIQLIEQLPEESLREVLDLLNALPRRASASEIVTHERSEEDLLHVIHRQLLPQEQMRLDYLREQNEHGDITEAEHYELLTFVSRVENEDAERAAAILQLAQIRKVDALSLITEFASPMRTNHAV
jgi:hypothetical protein